MRTPAIGGGLFVLCLLSPAFARADVITTGQILRLQGTDISGGALTRAGGGGPFRADLPGTIDDFITFCLERSEPAALDQDVRVASISSEARGGGLGGVPPGGTGDPISPTTAFLYTRFRAGDAAYQDGVTLQHAIWFLEDEESPVFSPDVSALLARAADDMTSSGWTPGSIGAVQVLNLQTPGGDPFQDMLVVGPGPNPVDVIPEPASLLLLGTGMSALGWLRRRGRPRSRG
jgi:hypothetical protein